MRKSVILLALMGLAMSGKALAIRGISGGPSPSVPGSYQGFLWMLAVAVVGLVCVSFGPRIYYDLLNLWDDLH